MSVAFAHAAEAELAAIFDFYRVRWQYEPHTFDISWDADGNVIERFAPDFYLPDLGSGGTYVECTTLRQSLTRRKNRKARRLAELHPEIRIKVFYARDFRALMTKFGRRDQLPRIMGAAGELNNRPA